MPRDTSIPQFRTDPEQAIKDWNAYKRGDMTLEQLCARLAQRQCPADVPTPRHWRAALYRAAARQALTVPDVASLERNKGGTEG
jgi:hypothetical protein